MYDDFVIKSRFVLFCRRKQCKLRPNLKKKKHFVSEEMWKKELCEMCFFVLFGLVFLFCFVLVLFVFVVVLVLMQNPLQPFSPLFSQFCFFLFVLFLFSFSKNWENYCEQDEVSKNLGGGGGKRWKAQFKSNVCDLLRLKCLFVFYLA